MNLRNKAAEVMADAIRKNCTRLCGDPFCSPGRASCTCAVILGQTSLTALLAFLAQRGLRVMPVEKTFTDAEIASINWPQPGDPHDGIGVDEARDCASGVWAAMIETIPNVWEEECMTSAALGDAP
jgi:hypothetical protein